MSELISITSEALQATIRRLLPSQRGFGEDLQASNVIVPIIDVTPTAEGTQLRTDLQTALDKGVTQTTATGGTTTITSTPGFYSLYSSASSTSATYKTWNISVTDGFSTTVLASQYLNNLNSFHMTVPIIVFISAGESLTMSLAPDVTARLASKQIADVNGNFVNPQGFTPQ